MTKYQRLGSLNNRKLFSHCSGSWKSKVRKPADLAAGEGQRPGQWTAAFQLYPHTAPPFPHKGTNPIMGASPSWPHLTLITSQVLTSQTLTRGLIRVPEQACGEGHRPSVHSRYFRGLNEMIPKKGLAQDQAHNPTNVKKQMCKNAEYTVDFQ